MEKQNDNNIAILVMGYNRVESLKYVLDSLQNLIIEYPTPLIISIDGGGTDEINKLVQSYVWRNGEKKVIIHSKRLGLRNHFLWAGDQTEEYNNILFLEDDILPSPYAVVAARELCSLYANDQDIAAGSLYSPMLCEFSDVKFPRVFDDTGCFMLAHPYWGTIWMKDGWKRFKEWYSDYKPNPSILPDNVAKWRDGSSFKKVFIQYLIETNRTCIYPEQSYVTNMGFKGENNTTGLYCFQTNLAQVPPTFSYCPLSQKVPSYDAFMELTSDVIKRSCPELASFDFTTDFKQVHKVFHTPYVLTTRPVKKAILSFSDRMKPVENGVLLGVKGTGISLALKENVIFETNERYAFIARDIKSNYRIHPKTAWRLLKDSTWEYCKSRLKTRSKVK